MVFLYRSHILVSIPYRLATNRDGGKEKKMIRMFQFLIGWLQTLLQMLCLLTGPQAVSIPYRLATNIAKTKLPLITDGAVSIPYRLATNKR